MKINTHTFSSRTAGLALAWLLLSLAPLSAQTVIGGAGPDSSAILELRSSGKGLLLPRMSAAEREAISQPQTGMLVFNTTLNCIEVNKGTPASPVWNCLGRNGLISGLNCGGATSTGLLVAGVAASGASVSLPYTGGNGGVHSGQTVASTGVTGLTATLAAGNFKDGSGTLSYAISGTPAAVGTASFALNIGGQTCTLSLTVVVGSIGALNCAGASVTGTPTAQQAASGVSVSVPYTGGNGGPHSGQTVASTGVTGLTATLSAGNFANGAGTLVYAISGTATASGNASFALNIGGKSCSLSLEVLSRCRAKVSPTVTKAFLCHNLASANTNADPFTPSWEIIGGYWQWGRKGPSAPQWLNTNTPNFAHGPTGGAQNSFSPELNAGVISDWAWNTPAPDGAWSDGIKTGNDPCPQNFRVPTKADWDGVLANNTTYTVGSSWTGNNYNYTSARFFGPNLMLPTAGFRNLAFASTTGHGFLSDRGGFGIYWSTTGIGVGGDIWQLKFGLNYLQMDYSTTGKTNGLSIRCIAE